ncbi:MAG: hypothetical protein IKE33_00270 [Erysipelotrichaceae bacterium]|nr:hypothetical protein [Erysipelotrichaceae bacterium]
MNDAYLSEIFELFKAHHHEVYLVGGALRDHLLKRPVYDFDLTTDASTEKIVEMFKGQATVFKYNEKYGTVVILIGDRQFEITPYRLESTYSDNRHPDDVSFNASLKEDLSRRDFTINALAYAPDKDIIDLFDGLKDLKDKIIRTVNDPDTRFNEDALRILRALRFSAQLSFAIEEKTEKAIFDNYHLLANISAERIKSETDKILSVSSYPLLKHYKEIFKMLMGNIDIDPKMDEFKDIYQKLAWIYRDEPDYQEVLKQHKYSNKEINLVRAYHESLSADLSDPLSFATFFNYRKDAFDILSFRSIVDNFDYRNKYEELKYRIVSELAIDGNDLMDLGYHDRRIKEVFDHLTSLINRGSLNNNRNELLEYLKSHYN